MSGSAEIVQTSPIRWSHSQLEKFKNCPYSWYRIYKVKDIERSESTASKWGNYVHEGAENFVQKGTPLPADVTAAYGSTMGPILSFLMSKPSVMVEPHRGITEDMQALADPDDPSCWSHGFIDIVAKEGKHAWIADWKTGQSVWPSNQLKLYSAYEFIHNPELETITASYVRLPYKRIDSAVYTRAQVSELLTPYRVTYATLLSHIANNNFPKIAGKLCGHCEVLDCPKNRVKERT